MSDRWMREVRIHPDGSRVAFTAGDFSGEVWMLEGLSRAGSPLAAGARRGAPR